MDNIHEENNINDFERSEMRRERLMELESPRGSIDLEYDNPDNSILNFQIQPKRSKSTQLINEKL